MDADWPGASEPFQGRDAAVTAAPDCVHVADQPCVTFWLPGNVKPSFQLVHGVVPVFFTVTAAVKPPFHVFAEYVTAQPPAGVAGWVVNCADGESWLVRPAPLRATTTTVYAVDGE